METMEGYALMSDIANKLKINKSKLMYYEKTGLLVPFTIVGPKKMRIYDLEDTVSRIRFIEEEKKKKTPLADIKKLLEKK